MKLIFIGSGSAFTIDNYQSNMLLVNDQNKRLLIDCGCDARRALHKIGLTYKEIDHVYISHLHSDHVGGLEWLGFCRKFDPSCGKPKLILSSFLKNEIWSNTLSGGMKLSTYFDVESVSKNSTFIWENTKFRIVQTVHIIDAFSIVPSFGLIFETNKNTVFITTDTQHCPNQIQDFYNMSDIIFQDCEITPYKSGAHANYENLKTLSEDTKKKMWLYHYQDLSLPDAKKDGFMGFVKRGQTFNFD